jgi:peptidoglycan/xylan/chitin deacetylase (PgdA/CDA1 family)
MLLHRVKRAVVSILAAPGVTAPFYPLMRGRATVFMLHRFRDPERGIEGTDPAFVRRALGLLRRRRFEFVSLADLFRRLQGDGPPLRRAIAFTIDDGYADHAEIAAPLFAQFDCPVTTFVTTGFLDGDLWFWWDRINWVFRRTNRRRLQVEVADEPLEFAWDAMARRAVAEKQFVARCKTVPDEEKLAVIIRLAAEAEVPLPKTPPAEYAPMTWDQLRACESRGMSFGPHTVTHPILSNADDAQSRQEIVGSWARLRAHARAPVPVFCYPNGGLTDFGVREISTMREIGLEGAVVGTWGFADDRQFGGGDADAAFRVRRIPFPGDMPNLIQYVSGVEAAKLAIRGSL